MEKIERTEPSAAAKVCKEMEKPEIIKSMAFLSAVHFRNLPVFNLRAETFLKNLQDLTIKIRSNSCGKDDEE